MRNVSLQRIAVLMILLCFCCRGNAADPKCDLVCMAKPANTRAQPPVFFALEQEMVRQGVLLAARSQLGAYTRDDRLGESQTVSDAVYGRVIRLKCELDATQPGTYGIRLEATTDKGNLARQIPLTVHLTPDRSPIPFLLAIEPLTRQQFAAALKDFGIAQVAVTSKDPAVPASVQTRLDQMNYFAQIDALQQLHQIERSAGASPGLLSAITRGYANLGLMSQHHFNSAFLAFQARSLLYAQRMVGLWPNDALSHWSRAYAMSLTGLHTVAAGDIANAQKLAGGKPAPYWSAVIRPVCDYDTMALMQLAKDNERVRPLASMLLLLTVECTDSMPFIIEVASNAYELNPYCFHLLDAATRRAGVGPAHVLTSRGLPDMADALCKELPVLASRLPDDIMRAWKAAKQNPVLPADVASIAEALADSSAPAEPSWACLGDMILQTDFVQTMRRARFMAINWSVETDGYLRESAVLVRRHPLRGYLDSFHDNVRTDGNKRAAILRQLQITEYVPALISIGQDMKRRGLAAECHQLELATGANTTIGAYDMDLIVLTQARAGNAAPREAVLHFADMLERVSPHSPVPAAARLHIDFANQRQQIPQLQAKYGHNPLFNRTLGVMLIKEGAYAQAIAPLTAYTQMAADEEAWGMLADAYLQTGDEAKWLSTLEAFLDEPDYGLSHAAVRCTIATRYLSGGEYQKALPYANEAAETWAGWAMLAAGAANEGVGDLAAAKMWYERNAQRYDDSQQLCLFYVRTNSPAFAACRRDYERQYAAQGWAEVSDRRLGHAVMLMMDGQLPKAQAELTWLFQQYKDPGSGLALMTVQDQLKDSPGRDATLAAIAALPADVAKTRPALFALVKLFREALANKTGLNTAAYRTLCQETDFSERTNLNYFAGRFLLSRGATQAGNAELKLAAAGFVQKYTCTLAKKALPPEPASRPANKNPAMTFP